MIYMMLNFFKNISEVMDGKMLVTLDYIYYAIVYDVYKSSAVL